VTQLVLVPQGSAEGRTLQDAAGRSYGVALVSRRSRLHPGMRYIARGLNALASPGNEAEVEQLLWTEPSGRLPPVGLRFTAPYSMLHGPATIMPAWRDLTCGCMLLGHVGGMVLIDMCALGYGIAHFASRPRSAVR